MLRANAWIEEHAGICVVSCETITWTGRNYDQIYADKCYLVHGQRMLRGLRLVVCFVRLMVTINLLCVVITGCSHLCVFIYVCAAACVCMYVYFDRSMRASVCCVCLCVYVCVCVCLLLSGHQTILPFVFPFVSISVCQIFQ